jgi:hypothetical protein
MEYNIHAVSITPAVRGYYGETWRVDTSNNSYFIKLDYFPRHQMKYRNSLQVVAYLCNNGIDFIGNIIKSRNGELYTLFNSAVMGVFEWINAENLETDDTKIFEYQMLCKIYPLTKPGFNIPTIEFSGGMSVRFYEKWEQLKKAPASEVNSDILLMFQQHSKELARRASRLSHFASYCSGDMSDFYITHGDAGGNFLVGEGKHYIVDWDEVMYAPLERDAWVMCYRDWARKLFADTLKQHGIDYELRPERLAFYIYHMYFLYLGEFLDDFMIHGKKEELEGYFRDDYFMEERVQYADMI